VFPILLAIAAVELPRGHPIAAVAVDGAPGQSYALYLPASYSPDRRWPILYCLDPMARGGIPVKRFAAAAEKDGFIVAGSNNCRNGPIAPEHEAIRWMLTDTHARLEIDDARVYAAGMSGGARAALEWAQNGAIAGVVACAAGFGNEVPREIPFRLFATAGVDDFNYDELFQNSLDLARRGIAHRFVEFDGGHDWLPEPLALEALDFFLGRIPPAAAQPSTRQKNVANRFATLMERVQSDSDTDRRKLLDDMRGKAAKPADSDQRRIGRRVVMSTFIGGVEQGRQAMDEKNYARAANYFGIALAARPETGEIWYEMAVASAGTGNKRGAMEALQRAVANGFNDRARVESEPLLQRVRKESRYRALLERLK
jgi:hypothetical protein